MMILSQFRQLNLSVVNVRTYLFAVLFVGGNMLLPQLCHLMPDGGKIFLPIYFFTLIASYKFGLKVGILTAVLSPLCNHLLFGMPPAGMLPVLLVKSTLLALVGAIVADRSQRVSLLHVAAVVVAYQVLGGIAEWLIASDLSAALQDFKIGFPGMLLQVVLGWVILQGVAKYESGYAVAEIAFKGCRSKTIVRPAPVVRGNPVRGKREKNIIGRGPGKNRNNLELCPTVVARCGGCCSEDFCCQWECRLLPV